MNQGERFDVAVIGAGAAGVGIGVALKHAGIENSRSLTASRLVRHLRGGRKETCFITPSFATSSIGMLDLNSIAIDVSPA